MTKKDVSGIFTIVLVLVPPLVFGLRHQTAEMTVSLMAGSIAAIFWNLEKFKNFKAGGVEAELRQAVEEAHATIKQLRDMAVPLIGAGIHLLKSANRMGYGLSERESVVVELYKATRVLGVDTEQPLVRQFEDFWRLQARDAFEVMAEAVRRGEKPEIYSSLRCLRDEESRTLPEVNDVEKALGGLENLTPEIDGLFSEYRDALRKFHDWPKNT